MQAVYRYDIQERLATFLVKIDVRRCNVRISLHLVIEAFDTANRGQCLESMLE